MPATSPVYHQCFRLTGYRSEVPTTPTQVWLTYCSGSQNSGKHLLYSWQTQGPWGQIQPALHLVLSGPTPCLYPAAAPSSLPLVEEYYIFTALKLHSALWGPLQSWCGPWWKWVWHPWLTHIYQFIKDMIKDIDEQPEDERHRWGLGGSQVQGLQPRGIGVHPSPSTCSPTWNLSAPPFYWDFMEASSWWHDQLPTPFSAPLPSLEDEE